MRRYRHQIMIGLLIAIGIYIVYLLVADSQLQLNSEQTIQATLAQFNWGVLPILIALQLVVIGFRLLAWHLYLRVINGHTRLSLVDSFLIQSASFTLVVSPGKAGEVLKTVLLKAKSGIPIAQSMPIVIAERVVDGLAVILIMSGTILIAGDQLNLGTYNGVDYGALSRVITFSSLAVIVAGLVVVQIQPLAEWVLRLIGRLPLVGRLQEPLTTFYHSSRQIFHWRVVIPMCAVGLGVYLPSCISLMVILAGFGVDITWQIALQATFIVGVTSAIGALSFVPNGAGITEISNLGMLLAFVAPIAPMVTAPVASATSLLQGFFHKWFRVLFGLTIAFLFRNRLFSEATERELQAYETEHQVRSTPA